MRLFLLIACGVAILSAEEAPIGIIHGELISWKGATGSGELHVSNEGRSYQCGFDAKTYFERDGQRIAPPAMANGDRLEIVADRKPGTTVCYARTVHVLSPHNSRITPIDRYGFRTWPDPTEQWFPRGDMTFSGVVMRLDSHAVTIRTRNDGEQRLMLRSDTRYLGNGIRVDAHALKPNMRVFIRAGRNLDDEVEAYQVIWGKIVQPED
jgi:hypothetical protein